MKRQREWNDNEELRDEVYQALEDAGLDVRGSEEEGPHREQGTITIRTADGRTFQLELWETNI